METYVLKIGGSAVTEKARNEPEAKKDEIRRIAREIRKAISGKSFRLVIVHGGGSFGHKLVSEYGIKDGLKSERDAEGFVRTHNAMEDLNKVFMDIFREEGLLGFPVQPSACIIQKGKKISWFETRVVGRLLSADARIIPILYGDIVIDEKQGASVVSGDAIVPYIARKLKASKVFMGSDVDGIFDADPKSNRGAKLVEKINKGNFDSVLENVGGSSPADVTGGMRGKLVKLREDLKGMDAVIFDITKEGSTYNALSGGKIRCTEISF